jgi:protein SCO1/2
MKSNALKRAALVSILVLPFFIYFIFVYSAKENFFRTLPVVGPRQVIENADGSIDTVYYTVPLFEMINQRGDTLTRDDLMGKVTVVNFFFTSCPTICPAMNFNVKGVQERFKGYEDFQIFSFTVDPERDSVGALARYAQRMGAAPEVWQFLTGNRDELYALAQGCLVNAMQDSTAPGGFLHSESLLLIDWEGRIRSRRDDQGNVIGAYNGLEGVALGHLKDDVKVLIAEREKERARQAKRDAKQ